MKLKLAFITIMMLFVAHAFSIEQNCIPGSATQGCTGGSGSGGGTTTSCTVTTNCSNGSVSCTSVNNDCKRGLTYVKCDGIWTYC